MANKLRLVADIVVLCMISDVELRAIENEFSRVGLNLIRKDGPNKDERRYSYNIRKTKPIDIILICLGAASNVQSGIITTSALFRYKPRNIFMCGIAGSMQPRKYPRGSVVVASSVTYRRVSKIIDGNPPYMFENPPVMVTSRGQSIARDMMSKKGPNKEKSAYMDGQEFRVFHERILSWDIVLDSSKTRDAIIVDVDRQISAVEMEAAGFFLAIDHFKEKFISRPSKVSKNGDVDGIVIRGISDLAAEKQSSDEEGMPWRHIAASNAAKILVEMIQTFEDTHFSGA